MIKGCKLFGVGNWDEFYTKWWQIRHYSRAELEYFVHRYLGIIDISYLLGRRLDLEAVKANVDALKYTGKYCYIEMHDKTRLFRLQMGGLPDDKS